MENYLKKEFKQSDVNRIRNIITKKFNEKTKTQVGYNKDVNKRKEGEIWEEDGRKWTILNGLRQNLTKLDSVKKLVKVPLLCPKCKGTMNHRVHKKMYTIHGFCFECTLSFEADLRKAGKYEEYERAMVTGNMKAFARDLENWALSLLEESTISFVTEDGTVEDWGKYSKDSQLEIFKKVKEYVKQIDNL
jgi:hypothetical protein